MATIDQNELTAQNIVELFIGTNEPPTEDQRRILIANLRDLESRFETETGKRWSDWEDGSDIPKTSRQLVDLIKRHQTCLSPSRHILEEIWRTIFGFYVTDALADKPPYPSVLLSRVCSFWRSAALGEPNLWKRIPSIEVPTRTRAPEAMLKTYLSRSGALPITWYLSSGPLSERSKPDDPMVKLLSLLVEHCRRWEEINLMINPEHLEHLSDIEGNLPILSNLTFGVLGAPQFGMMDIDPVVRLFAQAPSLREVRVLAPGAEEDFLLDVPWAQLEAFFVYTSGDPDPHSGFIFAALPQRLHTLNLTVNTMPRADPSTMLTLPGLKKLTFRLSGLGITELTGNLDTLRLPALTNLAIRGWNDRTTSIYATVLSLINRSSCRLQRLTLEKDEGRHPVALSPIFAASPDISEMELCNISDADAVGQLQLFPYNASSTTPVLPKLKKLRLRYEQWLQRSVYVEAAAFMRMYKSRTEALGAHRFKDAVEKGTLQILEEIEFDFPSEKDLHHQLSLLDQVDAAEHKDEASAHDLELRYLATKVRPYLLSHFVELENKPKPFEVKIHYEMHIFFKSLEKVEPRLQTAQVLLKRGIPYNLQKVASSSASSIPSDLVFQFRKRARKLCEKWKPFLLQAFRESPYYWDHTEKKSGRAILRWKGVQIGGEEKHAAEEEFIWRDLVI